MYFRWTCNSIEPLVKCDAINSFRIPIGLEQYDHQVFGVCNSFEDVVNFYTRPIGVFQFHRNEIPFVKGSLHIGIQEFVRHMIVSYCVSRMAIENYSISVGNLTFHFDPCEFAEFDRLDIESMMYVKG